MFKNLFALFATVFGGLHTAEASTYTVSQTAGQGSYTFGSTYDSFVMTAFTAPISYEMDFGPSYSSVQFSKIKFTSPELTTSMTASFPTGIGQPLASVTTTLSLTISLTVPTYQPTATIYAGPGGYRVSDTSSNLYAATVGYTGTYTVEGPTETKSGAFSTHYSTTTWSNLPYDFPNSTANDPVINFSGSGPVYDIDISSIAYRFYRGGATFSDLISETVDGVSISVRPSDYFIQGSSSVAPVFVPEPSVGIMTAAWAVGACLARRRRR